MGPTIIFDKSTLQSISINESVFLQQFFLTNLTPLFYVETLGDLALGVHKGGRPIIDIISALAIKVPSSGIFPNVHHSRLVVGNLLGQRVEMDSRTIRDGGEEKIDPEGNIGIHYSESKEEIALKRWHNREYSTVERLFSREWRMALSNLSFDLVLGIIKNVVPATIKLSNLNQIKEFVDNYLRTNQKELLYLAFELLGLPQNYYFPVLRRWNKNSSLSFEEFAPYAAYVLKIDLFFYISMLRGFESKDRPSHKIDLAYLYYLPFCNVFVSNDKLHKRLAPLFLGKNQLFVDGADFKKGLSMLNGYYSQYADKIAEQGFMGFTYQPPTDLENKVSEIWDKIFPNWRRAATSIKEKALDREKEKELLDHLKKIRKESIPVRRVTHSDKVHHVIMTHRVPVQKGKWRILPKGIENQQSARD